MSFMSAPKTPQANPIPAPQLPDSSVTAAGTQAAQRAGAGAGFASTIMTGPQGTQNRSNLAMKSLIGD